ncbi:putative aspartic peptidase A1 family, aspartic peptidase domain superfamily, xylanase inhibitor [Helianthus annuus]|nr:putative aspartic peptidase A1 family, aspartic peptidase domain superfamily, xylanase inhibitor [Helianthus annuus]
MCIVTPLNPVSKACIVSNLTTDLLRPHWTDGRNPINSYPNSPFGTRFLLSTAPKSLDQSFPKDVRGVAGFSWSGLCLPHQLASTGVTNAAKFALCLPSSSSALGVTFVGEGPFYFKTNPNVDLRSYLSYTPMIQKSSKSLGYYIKINRILIKGTPVNSVPKGGSVKMSTIVTYTTLKVISIKLWLQVFQMLRLAFLNGKIWNVSVENSIKRVGYGVACLAFVDGGSKVTDPIVIGTFQMENNFLYFDLVNQKLGFSSSLLSRGTSCSSFNFKLVAN